MCLQANLTLINTKAKCTAKGLVLTHYIVYVLKLYVKSDASCSNSSTYNLQ